MPVIIRQVWSLALFILVNWKNLKCHIDTNNQKILLRCVPTLLQAKWRAVFLLLSCKVRSALALLTSISGRKNCINSFVYEHTPQITNNSLQRNEDRKEKYPSGKNISAKTHCNIKVYIICSCACVCVV